MSLLFHEAQFHRQRGGPSATNHVYSSAAAGDELFVASRTNLAVLSPRSMGAYEPPKVSGATSSSAYLSNTPKSYFTDVPLCNIPDGAEFVCVDVLLPERIIAVAVRSICALPGTIVKDSSFALHIYGCMSPPKSSWARIATDCQIIPLGFTPFCMQHVPVSFLAAGEAESNNARSAGFHRSKCNNGDNRCEPENMILVSGSDGVVHAYRRHPHASTYIEIAASDAVLPELAHSKGEIVVSMDMHHTKQDRWLAMGCQSGLLLVSRMPSRRPFVECPSNALLHDDEEDDEDGGEEERSYERNNHSQESLLREDQLCGPREQEDGVVFRRLLDGPLPSVSIYEPSDSSVVQTTKTILSSVHRQIQFGQGRDRVSSEREDDSKRFPVDLAVAGAIGYGAVYQDIEQFCLSNSSVLPKSSSHDSVICTCTADLNMDGRTELVLGTYGQEMLVFRTLRDGEGSQRLGKAKDYVLDWQRSFAYPLYSVNVLDCDGDGLDELTVTSLRGVHVLKPDVEFVAGELQNTVNALQELMKKNCD